VGVWAQASPDAKSAMSNLNVCREQI